MRVQYLTGENIIFKMRLGCIRMLLQYLTGETTIIDDFRVHKYGASISHW